MRNNNTIMNILQTLLTEEEVEELAKKNKYTIKSRKITVYSLLCYPVSASIEQSETFRETVGYAPKYGLKLAIDSSTITTSKTQLKWAGFHRQRAGIKLHVQFNVDSFILARVEESNVISDITCKL